MQKELESLEMAFATKIVRGMLAILPDEDREKAKAATAQLNAAIESIKAEFGDIGDMAVQLHMLGLEDAL